MNQIDTLLFDADGVIQQTPPAFRAQLEGLCRDPARTSEFLSAVFAAEEPCLRGEADFEESLADVLTRWEIPARASEVIQIWTLIEPDREILEIVSALRSAGTVVCLATNQPSVRARWMCETLGYSRIFSHVFSSCDIRLTKPDVAYFRAVLKRLQRKADQVLFIDDRESNVIAARSVGMAGELFDIDSGPNAMRALLRRYHLDVAPTNGNTKGEHHGSEGASR